MFKFSGLIGFLGGGVKKLEPSTINVPDFLFFFFWSAEVLANYFPIYRTEDKEKHKFAFTFTRKVINFGANFGGLGARFLFS